MVDMAERRKNWSREETLAALFLYLALPARLIDDKGEDVLDYQLHPNTSQIHPYMYG